MSRFQKQRFTKVDVVEGHLLWIMLVVFVVLLIGLAWSEGTPDTNREYYHSYQATETIYGGR